MANNLTGDFEAVVQIAVRQINGLLGNLHQRGAEANAPMKLLHSVSMRVGDPRPTRPDLGVFGDWVLELQDAEHSPGRGLGLDDLRNQLTETAPPGIAKRLVAAIGDLLEAEIPEIEREQIRGRVKLQLSSVEISVQDGSTTEITVHAQVRAAFYPDPETPDLPAPVHGKVSAAFEIHRVFLPHEGRRLLIRPSANDSKIQFTAPPGSGLSASDAARIATQVRTVVREGFEILPVALPQDFPFADFKCLGSGTQQAIALPTRLSGSGSPAGSLQTITQRFIGGSGFGFAVSSDFVSGLIDVEAIREAITQRRVTFSIDLFIGSLSATYRFRFSSGPTLTFRPGAIEVSGRVEVETDTWGAPNGFVSFTQPITLALDTATQSVRLEPAGDPSVDESWFIPHGRAVDIVKSEMQKAMAANAGSIQNVFASAKANLVRGLRIFDGSASAAFTGIDVVAAGVVVRGELDSAPRTAPVVRIAETHGGEAFTALDSWIPGGRIDRFVWSWVEYGGRIPTVWSGVQKSSTEEHRFILPKPPGITELSQICLRVEGTRTLPSGFVLGVSGGTVCQVQEPVLELDVPGWWEPLTVPTWRPDLSEGVIAREAILGHVGVHTDLARAQPLTQNALIHFPDWQSEAPLDRLTDALARVEREDDLPAAFVVLPEGAFDATRRELEARLAPAGERLRTPLRVTEDDEGGWTRTFAVEKRPSTYLMNSRRELVLRQEGELDPEALRAALEEHRISAPAPGFRPLSLAVSTGDPAPDVTFDDDQGNRLALRRLRGQAALLNFWQSWSAPCLAELQRLQELHRQGDGPFVVGFHGGNDEQALERVRKELEISFPLVQDSEQRIARRFGVRCWPTTIELDPDGGVEQVRLGVSTGLETSPDPKQQSAAR